MPLRICVKSTAIENRTRTSFISETKRIFEIYEDLRISANIPSSDIEVILADNYAEEVSAILNRQLGTSGTVGEFDVRRDGGINVAKVLPETDDYAAVTVVIASEPWLTTRPSVAERLERLYVVAHELAHVPIERARHASGVMAGVVIPSQTGTEIARSLARILSGEYRADALSDAVLRHVAAEIDGYGAQGIKLWDLFAGRYMQNTHAVLSAVYPFWPDMVQKYRTWQVTLNDMWFTICRSLEGTITALVHAQALSDTAHGPDLLETEPLASLPTVKLYLRQPWSSFHAALRVNPVLPSLSKVAPVEEVLIHEGELMIREIWRSLGLETRDLPERRLQIDVSDPLRLM